MYRIIMCYSCGRLLLAIKDQKSRRCPHCGARINTERARFIASAPTAREASELLRKLKHEKAPPQSTW